MNYSIIKKNIQNEYLESIDVLISLNAELLIEEIYTIIINKSGAGTYDLATNWTDDDIDEKILNFIANNNFEDRFLEHINNIKTSEMYRNNEINKIKSFLTDTDYIIIKINESSILGETPLDNILMLNLRKRKRQLLNILETQSWDEEAIE